MLVQFGHKKYSVYAMDFESHNDDETIQKGETSIWLGYLINENSKWNDPQSYYYTIDELLERLNDLTSNEKKNRQNLLIYVWNLSFEWSFLLPVLIEKGYKFKRDIKDNDSFCYNSISTQSVSSVWSITLKMKKSKGFIVFRDLQKLFNGSLRNVAASFGLPTQKGEIDYTLNRLHGHVVTDEEKIYCFKDCRIVMDILVKMKDDKVFWRNSSSSGFAVNKMITEFGYPKAWKPMVRFREDYPIPPKEENDFLRNTYAGGICYACPDYQFKIISNKILHIDMHNAHPSMAYKHRFPYGKGRYFQGKPNFKKGCQYALHVKVSYWDVKVHCIIKLIGITETTDFELWLWDFELELMWKCYIGLDYTIIDGYEYDTKNLPWKNFYAYNYNKRKEAKKRLKNGDKSAQFDVMYYKLLNNSSYGKLCERPHNEYYINQVDEKGIITSQVEEIPPDEQMITAKYTALQVGSCIPARTREWLITTALQLSPTAEEIVYFDTDSIFIIATDEVMERWSKIPQEDFLCNWGFEEMIEKAQFTAPKRYKTISDGKLDVKMAGINFKKDYTYTELDYPYKLALQFSVATGSVNQSDDGAFIIAENIQGYSYRPYDSYEFDSIDLINHTYTIKRSYRCKGGTIIATQDKIINVQDKYKAIYDAYLEDLKH